MRSVADLAAVLDEVGVGNRAVLRVERDGEIQMRVRWPRLPPDRLEAARAELRAIVSCTITLRQSPEVATEIATCGEAAGPCRSCSSVPTKRPTPGTVTTASSSIGCCRDRQRAPPAVGRVRRQGALHRPGLGHGEQQSGAAEDLFQDVGRARAAALLEAPVKYGSDRARFDTEHSEGFFEHTDILKVPPPTRKRPTWAPRFRSLSSQILGRHLCWSPKGRRAGRQRWRS